MPPARTMLSLFISLVVTALLWSTGWAAVHFGRRYDEPEAKLRAVGRGFFVAGLLAGAFTFVTDRSQRRVTLFEEVFACPAGESRHIVEFDVQHPGEAHSILLAPKPESWRSASSTCDVEVRWTDAGGRLLLSDRVTLERIRPSGRMAVGRWIWDYAEWTAVPSVSGAHRVEFQLSAPDAASVLLRVEDPLKTDGVRARGY